LEHFPDKNIFIPIALNTPINFIESFVKMACNYNFYGFMIYGNYEKFDEVILFI
jgi:hypothetical protein